MIEIWCWLVGHKYFREYVSDYTKNPIEHRLIHVVCDRCGNQKCED